MWRVVIGVLLGMALIAGAAAAENSKQAAQPKCLKPCKPEDTRGQWSYGPACAPEPGGM